MGHRYLSTWLIIFGLFTALFAGWTWSGENQGEYENATEINTAIFAGGCFWCMEPPYDKLDGVLSTESGYTGGHTDNPTYKQVTKDNTGHYEAVKITYDSSKIDYETLLIVFWHNVDPLDDIGQFCDKGNSYRTAIFYADEDQQKLAIKSKNALEKSKYLSKPVVTKVLSAKTFYSAEDYHQNYYQKNPVRYNYYRFLCGRDKRLKELWGESAGIAGSLIPTTQSANE